MPCWPRINKSGVLFPNPLTVERTCRPNILPCSIFVSVKSGKVPNCPFSSTLVAPTSFPLYVLPPSALFTSDSSVRNRGSFFNTIFSGTILLPVSLYTLSSYPKASTMTVASFSTFVWKRPFASVYRTTAPSPQMIETFFNGLPFSSVTIETTSTKGFFADFLFDLFCAKVRLEPTIRTNMSPISLIYLILFLIYFSLFIGITIRGSVEDYPKPPLHPSAADTNNYAC